MLIAKIGADGLCPESFIKIVSSSQCELGKWFIYVTSGGDY